MFANAARAAGKAADVGSRLAASARERSIAALLDEMDRAGIALGMVPGRANSVLGSIPNDDLRAIVARHPERFVAFAGIDATERRRALAQVDAARAQGFKGVSLEPGLYPEPWHLDDARLYPIYARCEERDLVVLLMSGGNAGPDPTYSSPEHIDRVARDFPGMRIVAGHGNWPWVPEIIHVCYRRPNLWLSPDVYLNPMLPGAREYVAAANGFMSRRFLFGSAYPFSALEDAVRFMRALPFRPEVLGLVMRDNARRLLGLDA